jgi:hypothetical protein
MVALALLEYVRDDTLKISHVFLLDVLRGKTGGEVENMSSVTQKACLLRAGHFFRQ